MGDICQNIREQIPELITGALPPEKAAELRRHIDQCPACSEYLGALQADDRLLGDFTEGMQPTVARLEDKVIEELNREPSSERTNLLSIWRTIRKSAVTKVAAAAVIIMAASVGVKMFTGRVGQQRWEIARKKDVPSSVLAEHEKPGVAPPREVAIGMRKRTKVDSDAEIEAELAMVRKMIAAGDIDGLVAVLEQGPLESRIVAASYLAKIGDSRGIAALKKLPALAYVGSEPNSLIAMLDSVAERLTDANVSCMLVLGKFEGGKGREAQRLDGKDVVVRLYKDWRADTAKFETVSVQVAGRSVNFDSVKFDSNEVGDSVVVAVFGEDQTDVNVAGAMGDCIYAEPYKKGLRLSLSVGQFPGKEGLTVVFHDAFDANAAAGMPDWNFGRGKPVAIGKPIPEAEVEIFLRAYGGARIQVGRYFLDERGSLPVPCTRGSLNWFEFIVSHPEYGTAWVGKSVRESMTVISLPLVRRGSIAAERAIWGTIVDQEGSPVAGATIACREVRTLGEGLIDSVGDECKVVSDANGFFTFYMSNIRRLDDGGPLIPPKSRYEVKIEAPKELELLPYVGGIMNGQETTVVMEWGDYFHTFVFEDGSGSITELERLKLIRIIVDQKRGGQVRFGYDDWKNGGRFPLGTYRARFYGTRDKVEFEPLEVTEDSPEQLVFTLSDSIVYHGQVIHGLTDEPMEGALVIGMWGVKEGNLSHITSEQWEVLHELPGDPCLGDEALEPINGVYAFNRVVRTDDDGWFEMRFQPGGGLYGFVAFEEDYLGIMHRKHALEVDEGRRAEVPVIKLYPAAKIVVEPNVVGERISICPEWIIDRDGNPAWVRDFLATDDRSERFFTYDKWLRQNEARTFHVPAGLNLRIKLDTPYDDQWCPIIFEQTINLAQGEVLDLGRHTFQPALKVSVKVLNSAGESVEGVPVRKRVGGGGWDVPHNSDEKGVARFNVCPYTEGEFGVFYEVEDEDDVALRESIPYEVAGEEDSGREFIFTLSDEMLYHLFK